MGRTGFPYQEEIDIYYDEKKREARDWLVHMVNGLRRITGIQRDRLMAYANDISFRKAGELNAYVQGLSTVSKRDKGKISQYLSGIEWFPNGITVGNLDGEIVVKMMPNQLDIMLQQRGEDEEDDEEQGC